MAGGCGSGPGVSNQEKKRLKNVCMKKKSFWKIFVRKKQIKETLYEKINA